MSLSSLESSFGISHHQYYQPYPYTLYYKYWYVFFEKASTSLSLRKEKGATIQQEEDILKRFEKVFF
jgi:hypothetical protein